MKTSKDYLNALEEKISLLQFVVSFLHPKAAIKPSTKVYAFFVSKPKLSLKRDHRWRETDSSCPLQHRQSVSRSILSLARFFFTKINMMSISWYWHCQILQ